VNARRWWICFPSTAPVRYPEVFGILSAHAFPTFLDYKARTTVEMFLRKEEDPSLEDEEKEPMNDPTHSTSLLRREPRYGRRSLI
jgi:hypothetical protein